MDLRRGVTVALMAGFLYPGFVFAVDMLEISDSPDFETQGQNLWGTGVGANTKTCNSTLVSINDSNHFENTCVVDID